METITSARLRRLLEEEKTILVLFSGDWCPDCKNFMPIWKGFIGEAIGLRTVHVDVPRGGREWEEWDLHEVPTVVYYRTGVEKGRTSGLISAGDIDSLLHD